MVSEPRTDSGFFAFQNGKLSPCTRELVTEEPLKIILGDDPLVTLMRTPGSEEELALGFLLTEGLISSPKDVGAIAFCESATTGNRNELRVRLVSGAARPPILPQRRIVFSSCGIRGAETAEDAARELRPFELPAGRLTADDIFALGEAMRRAQERFRRTGGTHAAAIAAPPVSRNSNVIVREDIARHNALDKAVGAAVSEGLLSGNALLFVSGRLSLTMVAKAARAGISDLAAVSAPSAQAVELAGRLNMLLAGFARERTMTVYSGRNALRA